MRGFSANIREKPRWWEKVNDSTIVSRWRQEMVEIDKGRSKSSGRGEGLDYIFDELRYAAKQRDKKTGIESTAIPMVYQSTSLIPADIKAGLLIGVSVLEDVPMEEKDWHPGTKPAGTRFSTPVVVLSLHRQNAPPYP
ncbi:hypothetical protein A0H81_11561 [Grifola frondosa]|uniref:Uncharacterized protein n=1 Tax=Grifola frondosa TaxID=5627 RepID=A0A1C7LWJ4_GRIFR|nr:hypothetical protein A0H81_11561 [Grifola frondosa]